MMEPRAQKLLAILTVAIVFGVFLAANAHLVPAAFTSMPADEPVRGGHR
ncbi:hypothetical protein [Neoroseomonas lacus]|nr:hypothetical protein [Neoroseomonas lacus]